MVAKNNKTMSLRTAYVPGKGDILVLQQYECGGGHICVCLLAGNTAHSNRKTADAIADCCRQFPWQKWVRKPQTCIRNFVSEAEAVLNDHGAEDYGLLAVVGNRILLQGTGAQYFLLQKNLGRGYAERIEVPFEGTVEVGAGILMATKQWMAYQDMQDLVQALYLPGEANETRMAGRLRELTKETGSAVLLTAQEVRYGE